MILGKTRIMPRIAGTMVNDPEDPTGPKIWSNTHKDLRNVAKVTFENWTATEGEEPEDIPEGILRKAYPRGMNRRTYKPKGDPFRHILGPLTLEERRQLWARVKKDTAPGPSGISYAMLRAANKETQELTWELVELILTAQIIPEAMRNAKIKPIPKTAETLTTRNVGQSAW